MLMSSQDTNTSNCQSSNPHGVPCSTNTNNEYTPLSSRRIQDEPTPLPVTQRSASQISQLFQHIPVLFSLVDHIFEQLLLTVNPTNPLIASQSRRLSRISVKFLVNEHLKRGETIPKILHDYLEVVNKANHEEETRRLNEHHQEQIVCLEKRVAEAFEASRNAKLQWSNAVLEAEESRRKIRELEAWKNAQVAQELSQNQAGDHEELQRRVLHLSSEIISLEDGNLSLLNENSRLARELGGYAESEQPYTIQKRNEKLLEQYRRKITLVQEEKAGVIKQHHEDSMKMVTLRREHRGQLSRANYKADSMAREKDIQLLARESELQASKREVARLERALSQKAAIEQKHFSLLRSTIDNTLEVDDLLREMAEHIQVMADDNDHLTAQTEAAEAKVDKLELGNASTQIQLQDAEQRGTVLEAEIDRLKLQVDELDIVVASLEVNADADRREIARTEAARNGWKAAAEAAIRRLGESEEQTRCLVVDRSGDRSVVQYFYNSLKEKADRELEDHKKTKDALVSAQNELRGLMEEFQWMSEGYGLMEGREASLELQVKLSSKGWEKYHQLKAQIEGRAEHEETAAEGRVPEAMQNDAVITAQVAELQQQCAVLIEDNRQMMNIVHHCDTRLLVRKMGEAEELTMRLAAANDRIGQQQAYINRAEQQHQQAHAELQQELDHIKDQLLFTLNQLT